MKFGYFSLTDNPPGYAERRAHHNQLILDVVEQAIRADELGYHSAWLPEHHFGLFGVLPVPSQALSYIAARTKHIRLAPGTVVLPINNPVRMAEPSSPPGVATTSASIAASKLRSRKVAPASTKSCCWSAQRGPKRIGPGRANTTRSPNRSRVFRGQFKSRIRQCTWRVSPSRQCVWPRKTASTSSLPHLRRQ